MDYYITQAFSRQACLNKYLLEKRWRETSACSYYNAEEDVTHTLYMDTIARFSKEFTRIQEQGVQRTKHDGKTYRVGIWFETILQRSQTDNTNKSSKVGKLEKLKKLRRCDGNNRI